MKGCEVDEFPLPGVPPGLVLDDEVSVLGTEPFFLRVKSQFGFLS